MPVPKTISAILEKLHSRVSSCDIQGEKKWDLPVYLLPREFRKKKKIAVPMLGNLRSPGETMRKPRYFWERGAAESPNSGSGPTWEKEMEVGEG